MTETNREQITGCVDGSLRYRIAYAIAQADGDLPGMEPDTWDYELADAVIAELQPELTRHDTGCVCTECWYNRL